MESWSIIHKVNYVSEPRISVAGTPPNQVFQWREKLSVKEILKQKYLRVVPTRLQIMRLLEPCAKNTSIKMMKHANQAIFIQLFHILLPDTDISDLAHQVTKPTRNNKNQQEPKTVEYSSSFENL